jgi:CHAT domain-containing protein
VGFRKSIINKLDEDYTELAFSLYQQLFPFTFDATIQALIIIPDGNLSKLPFEALLSKKVNPRNTFNFSQLPYLVNDYDIHYALSARLYQEAQTASATPPSNEGLLAYAPVFAEPQSVNLFLTGSRNPLADPGTTRPMTMDGQFIAALPATANEIEAIADVFKEKGQKATTYLFKNANEKQLKQSDLRQSRYLHIATHGFIREDQPDLSGLLLFPDTTEREDHILYSGEVYNLDLNAQLVVLSACETGLGKVANGEGLLGLSRAFFYAGAENLVVSLWKVNDQATADLMVDFYQQHLNSANPQFAKPLRQAKLDMMRSADFSHPYYWSAFVLIGR